MDWSEAMEVLDVVHHCAFLPQTRNALQDFTFNASFFSLIFPYVEFVGLDWYLLLLLV